MTAPASKASISHVATAAEASIDLFWLPLGAGGCFVRLNGRIYEMVAARLERRPACDLYHSALEVRLPEGRFVIEQAPMRAGDGAERGGVAEGAVGSRWVGRARLFRYELHRGATASSPTSTRQSTVLGGSARTRTARDAFSSSCPSCRRQWGRDELRAGEMWNSNSMIAWLVALSGLARKRSSRPWAAAPRAERPASPSQPARKQERIPSAPGDRQRQASGRAGALIASRRSRLAAGHRAFAS